jgi:hypothetical protein
VHPDDLRTRPVCADSRDEPADLAAFGFSRAAPNLEVAFRLLFFGWWLGWLSASIARVVYPPPKSRRSTGTTT